MAIFACPCCGTKIPLSGISDADLLSERGRRNAAKRKTFGARPKGKPAVWLRHNPDASRCRCAECLLGNARQVEEGLHARIGAQVAAVGVEPVWAEAERARVRKRRSTIEWAILERQLDELEVSDGRAA